MASAKIATLLIRTIAKPISVQLKEQAKRHERFRGFCISLAQGMYRYEVRLRTGLLGEKSKHVRPLSETKAIENGANALAEGFLFVVAVGLIMGETWRSSRSKSRRRDDVDDKLEDLGTAVTELNTRVNILATSLEEREYELQSRNDELQRIVQRVVDIGLQGRWAEFEGTPLQLPRASLPSQPGDELLPTADTRIDVDAEKSSDANTPPDKDKP